MRTSEKERGKREKCKKERREGEGKERRGKERKGSKRERERTEEIQRFGNGTDSFLKKTDDSGCNAMEYGQ